MTTLAIIGAGGNMGMRVGKTLARFPDKYRLLLVETGQAGQTRLRERGVELSSREEALLEADIFVLAIADNRIKAVAAEYVPHAKSGAMFVTLDAAAPYSGHLPERSDISYFVTHPAHLSVFNDEEGAARRDYFGSGLAKQAVVSALMQGPESDWARGEEVAKDMFGPVLRSHRLSVEQMAVLEPALSETVAATLVVVMKEAMDEVIARGMPAQAARDFLLGHINIPLAIVFGEIEWDFSAGAKKMIEEAKKELLQPDWKKVFDLENVRRSVLKITEA